MSMLDFAPRLAGSIMRSRATIVTSLSICSHFSVSLRTHVFAFSSAQSRATCGATKAPPSLLPLRLRGSSSSISSAPISKLVSSHVVAGRLIAPPRAFSTTRGRCVPSGTC